MNMLSRNENTQLLERFYHLNHSRKKKCSWENGGNASKLASRMSSDTLESLLKQYTTWLYSTVFTMFQSGSLLDFLHVRIAGRCFLEDTNILTRRIIRDAEIFAQRIDFEQKNRLWPQIVPRSCPIDIFQFHLEINDYLVHVVDLADIHQERWNPRTLRVNPIWQFTVSSVFRKWPMRC